MLKDNYKIEPTNTKEKIMQTESSIIKEAEMIINEQIKETKFKYEELKIKKKYKLIKTINIILIILLCYSFIVS